MNENLLTISEIAKKLGLPESTIRYYRDHFPQYIPYVGKGRNRLYKPEALEVLRLIAKTLRNGGNTLQAQRILERKNRSAMEVFKGNHPARNLSGQEDKQELEQEQVYDSEVLAKARTQLQMQMTQMIRHQMYFQSQSAKALNKMSNALERIAEGIDHLSDKLESQPQGNFLIEESKKKEMELKDALSCLEIRQKEIIQKEREIARLKEERTKELEEKERALGRLRSSFVDERSQLLYEKADLKRELDAIKDKIPQNGKRSIWRRIFTRSE